MKLEQLEQRVRDLEKQVAELRRQIQPIDPLPNVESTFGMFADDREFDEIVKLGRENRERVNSGDL